MPLGAANQARFLFEAGGKPLLVVRFTAEEALSSPFWIELTLASEQEIRFDEVVGQRATLTVLGDEADHYWHGIVSQFSLSGARGRFWIYHARVVPPLWLLTQESDNRIFQGQNAQEIVEQVLKESGITGKDCAFRNQNPGASREYCVQYRESDFGFVSRLMEEEGIFYFFEHDKSKGTLTFADGPNAYQPIPGQAKVLLNPGEGMVPDAEFVKNIAFSSQIRSGKVTLRDFNFEKPALDLTSDKNEKDFANLELYEYPGRYLDPSAGKKLAQVRLQESVTFRDRAEGESLCARFNPGCTFSLRTVEKRKEFTREYLLVEVHHRGEQPQALAEFADPGVKQHYSNHFVCIPAAVTFRPPRKAPKPVISGVQTAIVVGGGGDEICTDEHARVKVQFPWDRVGKKNDKSSCWVRVSQTFAGAGFGAVFIPRVGQEVVVSFLEGDPDRPIVTGRVYDGANPPPYPLPDEKTKSTFKTNSTVGGGGFNELRFEDKKGQEEVFLHAQKDWNTNVHNNRSTSVGANQSASIGADKSTQVGGSHTESVGKDQTITVAANQNETVGSNRVDSIRQNASESVGIRKDLTVGAAFQITVGAAMNMTVGAVMAQEVGGAKIEIIGASKSVKIGTNASEQVGGKKTIKVAGDSTTSVGGKDLVNVSKEHGLKAKKILIEADEEIVIKTGQATLALKKNGDITINGKKINIKGSGDVVIKGSKIVQN